jgi:hypothetical protein
MFSILRSTGFVIKTSEKASGRKVFVNIVSHELVKRPVDASDKEVDEDHLDRLVIWANLQKDESLQHMFSIAACFYFQTFLSIPPF